MAATVIDAFNEFQINKVNLDSQQSKDANSSKDWLIGQLHKFPDNDSEFPRLWLDYDIHFGSFARHTKKRPLDDIDLMIGISAEGSTYNDSDYSQIKTITVPDTATNLLKLCNDNETPKTLNSIKVINKIIKSLATVPQYSNSEITRDHEAAVLNLTSYDWSFDIVPCFFTAPDVAGKTYYLIPDGNGYWKKTDPRIDRDRVIEINKQNDGNVLNVIRILKYWNKRATMPSAPSYMFENLILNFYENNPNKASNFVDMNLPNLFYHIHSNIWLPINDPKLIQGDLNTLSNEEKKKISDRAYTDYLKALDARQFERDVKLKESINKWREIFGNDFPEYKD